MKKPVENSVWRRGGYGTPVDTGLGMYGMLDISASGMIAQRTRLDVITSNIVNQNVILDAQGNVNPYKRRIAVFAQGNPSATSAAGRKFGVHMARIELDNAPAQPRQWDPESSLAFKSGPLKGYVAETNVNSAMENVNSLEATRAYEANIVAAEATKQMMASALRLIA